MASRPTWTGYLKRSRVACAVKVTGATTSTEKVKFRVINRAAGTTVRRQFVDAVSGTPVDPADEVKGYEIGKDEFLPVENEEIDALEQPDRIVFDLDPEPGDVPIPGETGQPAASPTRARPLPSRAIRTRPTIVILATRLRPSGVSSPSLRRRLSSATAGPCGGGVTRVGPGGARRATAPPASASVPRGAAAGSGIGTVSPVLPVSIALNVVSLMFMQDEHPCTGNVPSSRCRGRSGCIAVLRRSPTEGGRHAPRGARTRAGSGDPAFRRDGPLARRQVAGPARVPGAASPGARRRLPMPSCAVPWRGGA
jgi:hypothetical protein